MTTRLLFSLFLIAGAKQAFGQPKFIKFPPNINHTSISNFAPYISLDGNTLVYLANNAEDNELTMNMSVREGVNWTNPVTLPKSVNNRLNFMRGYAVSADGKTLYISSAKSNGLGGFDILMSRWTGRMWADPVNLMKPTNSPKNEACPSLSVDGTTMFFMRCEKMDFNKAQDCKILMMKQKSNGDWTEPVELPSNINTGNSQTPRIMGDNETLIFSSDVMKPNQGGMDLYFTRFINGQWANPEPLTFANTSGDDQYVSARSVGRYLLRDAKGVHENELVEILFPPEVRPATTVTIDGVITAPDPSTAYITVFSKKNEKPVFSTRPGKDGKFKAYLREGDVYDLSVEPEKDNFTFYSKRLDLTGEKVTLVENVAATLKPAETGDEIDLDGVTFSPRSADITPASSQELRRLARLMEGNPNNSFSILVTLKGFLSDSTKSDPDLTEIIVDTTRIPVIHKIDSINTETVDSLVIKKTYSNDRTLRQAKAVGDYLIKKGIPASRIACSGKALPEAIIEERKTFVKVVIH